MQLPEVYDDCGSHKSRILTWIEAVEAGSPEALKPRNDRLKRHCGQYKSITSPPKRKPSRNLTKRGPLAPTSGNTMSPQKKSGQTPHGKRRQSPRKHLPTTSQGAHEDDQDENEDVDEDTPRPSASVHSRGRTTEPGIYDPVPLPPPIFKGPRPDNASAASPTRSSVTSSSLSESLSNARSVSPIKQFVDLDMAERPATFEGLNGHTAERAGGVLRCYEDLVAIGRGFGVIPRSLKSFVEQNLHKSDWPPMHAYDSNDDADHDRHLGDEVLRIHQNAEKCEKKGVAEVVWNSKVHEPLYELVAEHPKYKGAIGSMNITTARIQPKSLAMTHVSGMKMGSKMVDFAIYMKPDKEMKNNIRYTLRGDLKESQSVNQTMHGPLRMCPIAISVETKLPFSGGDTADIQSATWIGAGLARIRQMLPESNDIPTMPALLAHGHQLHLVAFQEQVDSNVMYGRLPLGSSDTLLGTFQMAKALEVLVDWANTDYRAWYFDKVIRSG